ncbi:MAG: sigma 54-interacting transcriptional regulator [Eubacterium ramulus]
MILFQNIIGECPALQRLKGLALKVAQGNTSVLITGESGTGKELFAQSIHNNSPHSNGPFVAINCGGDSERSD